MVYVRFVFWCCCVLLCVCGVCGVCGVCVARLGTRGKTVRRFKTSPCVGSKRLRVYRQNARKNCPSITVQTPCHLEWGGHVSVLEVGAVFVFGCVWLCLVVFICVVFVVLLVASVLASMRWLLCGGDGSEEKTTSVISKKKKKNVPRENLSPLRF